MSNVVADTIAELNEGVDRPRALTRLRDWRERVHYLYDQIQEGLGPEFLYDRSGKHRTQEGVVQRAGLTRKETPAIDILRIERPKGTLKAIIQPRHLWVVGANGRLDLIVLRKSGVGRRLFELFDLSSPMSNLSDWRLVSGGEPLEQPRFTIEGFRQLLE